MLLVASDGQEGTKAAVSGELPGAGRKRCTSCRLPGRVWAWAMSEVSQDLSVPFEVRRERFLGPLRGVRLALWQAPPGGGLVFQSGHA